MSERRWRTARVLAVSAGSVAVFLSVGCADDSSTAVRVRDSASVDVHDPVPPDPLANDYPLIEEPTFELDEIAEAPFNVVAPKRLPEALRLLEAGYLTSGQRQLDESDCGKVVLFYADPAAMSTYDGTGVHPTYLQLDLVDVNCTTDDERDAEARAEKGAGAAEPIAVGGHEGTIARFLHPDSGPGFFVQLTVDGTDVFVDSTLSRSALLQALGELAPFDVASQPIWPTGE